MNTIVITCAVFWMTINSVSTQQQYRRVSCTEQYSSSEFSSLQEQLTSFKEKITGVEDNMQTMVSRDDFRLKLCGLLQLPSKIKDSQLTSSSNWNNAADHSAPHGRLFGTSGACGCWHAANNQAHDWIQVDLEKNENIYGVVTQGRHHGANQWMTSYSVSYKIDGGGNFRYVDDESGASVVFQGNVDTQTPVINNFHAPITARYFRVHKLTTNVAYTCIRIDLLAC